ncbi:Uncharacterised protein [Enterobacter hormaechei]|nr:Uncharacterised protein [Enterobacter hormaechei]SAD50666.1 Uncharacterised protein [Enterobacter cloacae]
MPIYFTQDNCFLTAALSLSLELSDSLSLHAQRTEPTDGIFTINDNCDCNFTDVRRNTIQCYLNAGLLRTGNELYCPFRRRQIIVKDKVRIAADLSLSIKQEQAGIGFAFKAGFGRVLKIQPDRRLLKWYVLSGL